MYSRPATEGPHVCGGGCAAGCGGGWAPESMGVLTCVLVKLVLDFRAARNLDHRVHDVWCCVAQLQIVPAKGVVEPAQRALSGVQHSQSNCRAFGGEIAPRVGC